MKNEINELPYVLNVIFTPQIRSNTLMKILENKGVKEIVLKTIQEKKYTSNFFEINTTKQTEIKITTILKNDFVEYLTINMALDTDIKIIKEIFHLFNALKEFSVEVIDEEIESMLNSENMADEFINHYSKIKLDFDNFYTNELKIPKRDILLKKDTLSY